MAACALESSGGRRKSDSSVELHLKIRVASELSEVFSQRPCRMASEASVPV